MANYLFLLAVVCLSVLLPTVTAQNGTHGHELCFVCETIVNVAKHEHPKDTKDLEKLLEKECKNIADFFHDTQGCLKIFKDKNNLQTIFNLLQNDTHSRQICAAINQCPASLRQARSAEFEDADIPEEKASHEYCFVCETIVNVAKHEHPKNTKDLEKLLEKECKNIADFFHDTKKCLEVFKNGTNLQMIFNLIQNDTHSRQICAAIDVCDRQFEDAIVAEREVDASLCAKCKSAAKDFKHLSKSGLSEELLGLCSALPVMDCSGTAVVDIDLLYDFYQAVGHSDAACYHLDIC
uniref:Saposin B-type domain-containing protein n=1 Tax=Plectus sambesii TaxID=2011161 RepID=A0A914VWD7_9BILA